MVFIDHGADNDSGALRLGLRKRSRGERAGQPDEQGNDKVPHWQEGERAAPLHRKRTRVARMYPVGQHKTAPRNEVPRPGTCRTYRSDERAMDQIFAPGAKAVVCRSPGLKIPV